MTELAIALAGGPPALAQQLSQQLDLPLVDLPDTPKALSAPAMLLMVSEQGLYLQQTGRGAPGPVSVDFGGAGMRHRRKGGHNELLGRAVGVGKKSPLSVLDATAGLARDSFVLADLGCELLMCERHPVIAILLGDALQRGRRSPDSWLQSACQRMTLSGGDARACSGKQLAGTDVIYLDPMFPARDKSASVKKEMAVFQRLLESAGDEDDSEALLEWALSRDVARVVVKRPAKAPVLGSSKPSHAVAGKSVRFDVYTLRGWH